MHDDQLIMLYRSLYIIVTIFEQFIFLIRLAFKHVVKELCGSTGSCICATVELNKLFLKIK